MIDWSQMIPAEVRVAEALAEAKSRARADLAAAVAAARAAYITTLPGQQMIYMAKEAEARAYVSDPAPDMVSYPLLSAEIGITAPDAWQLAQIWLAMADIWRSAAAQIEALRLSTAAAIEAAATPEAVEVAIATVRRA